jgi:hypothetical protein
MKFSSYIIGLMKFSSVFKSGVGVRTSKLKKVKVGLKEYRRRISKNVNKMAEVHGNRTHLIEIIS